VGFITLSLDKNYKEMKINELLLMDIILEIFSFA